MSDATKVLESMGAIEVRAEKAPFFHRRVERLVARAKIEKPRLYMIPDATPNACAVGLSEKDSHIAVTTGLFNNLDENEIDAVLAHEVGHIARGHFIEKTKTALGAAAIAAVANVGGAYVATSNLDFTPGDDNADDLASVLLKIGVGALIAGAGAAAAGYRLTKNALESEFEADRFGGELTKKPWALARALETIERLTRSGKRRYDPEVSQLFIVSPAYLNHQTHPATSDRINRLQSGIQAAPVVARCETIFCEFCGEKTDADGKFCYWCGKSEIAGRMG